MIIEEVKPELNNEIGTNKGLNSLYLADLLELQAKRVNHSIEIKGYWLVDFFEESETFNTKG